MFKHDHGDDPHPALSAVSGLSEEDAATVWSQGTVVTVPSGWSMIHEGAPPDTAYLILEGRTKVSLHNESVTYLGPGEFIGEIAPIAHRLRTATVTAVEPLLTLAFPTAVLTRLRRDVPSFDRAVTSVATDRIAEIDNHG